MSEVATIEAIFERWANEWSTLVPGVPYTFGNEAMTAADAWARLVVVHTVRRQASTGRTGIRRWETIGYVSAQLFADANAGARPIAEMIDAARTVLEARNFGNLTTRAAVAREAGTDGRWDMAVVAVPFSVYETR